MSRTVLHVIHTIGPGGAETVVLDLASGLRREGWHTLVTLPGQDWLFQALADAGVAPVVLSDHRRLAYLCGLIRLIRSERVDLVHAHLLGSAAYAALAALVCRVPLVCTFHGHSDITQGSPVDAARFFLIRRAAARIVLVSEPLRQAFLAAGRLPAEMTTVIPNGVDTARFRPTADRGLRAELRLPPNAFLVGAVGNIRPAKDYATFLRAAAVLAAASPAYRFVIVGEGSGPLRDELLRLRAELGLQERLTFTGFRSDVAQVLNSFDALLLSSSSEGFSLATVQAMACGLPVVATRCGGPESIITDGQDGVLVQVGDPAAIAAAVEQLRRRPDLRRELGAKAARTVADQYSRDAMLASYHDLYSGIHNYVPGGYAA